MRLKPLQTRTTGLALLLGLGALLAACSGGGNLATGAKYEADGQYRAAYIEAKKVLQHDAKDAQAWLLLGKASLWLGNPKDALAELDKARANGAIEADWVVPMGRALLVTQAYDKLLDTLPERPAFTDATNAQVLVLRGDAFRELRQFSQAHDAYQQALTRAPKDAPALVGMARLTAMGHDQAGAAKYVEQALAAAPDSAQAWTVKADLALAGGDAAGAAAAYQKALAIKHPAWLPQEQYYARGQLVLVQLQQDQLAAAAASAQALLQMAPQQPYSLYLHALVLYRQRHFDEAMTALQQVLQKAPRNVPAQLLLGAVNYAQGQYGQAGMQFSNVLGQDPGNTATRRLLALAQYRGGQKEQALATLRGADSGHATDAELLAQLQRASAAGPLLPGMGAPAAASTPATQPVAELGRADQALAHGDDAEAIRLLTRMPAGDAPLELQRTTLLVLGYVKGKHMDAALQVAQAYAAKHPGDSGAHLLYGTTLVTAGKRDAARAEYAEALRLDPKNLAVRLNLGSLEALDGQYPAAAASYQAVLKQDPRNAAAMTELGRLALKQGDRMQAQNWFTRAVAADPKAAAAYLGLVALYTGDRKFNEAVDTAQRLVAAAPGQADALNALGAAQFNAGHADAALQSLQRAVDLAPRNPTYRVNLARAQLAAKRPADARRSLIEAVRAEPGNVVAVALLAQLQAQDHDLAGALKLAAGLQHQPDTATQAAGFALAGDLYMGDKQYAKADAAYRQGLQIRDSQVLVIKHFQALAAGGAAAPDSVLTGWLGKHPDDMAVRLLLGQYYLARQQLAQAAAQYEIVQKANPNDIGSLNNLAWIYAEQHNPQALTLAARAYKLAPDAPGIADTYAWALLAANRPKDALPILARAAKAAPKVPEIQYHLAVAQQRTGDAAAAKATLQALQKSGAKYSEQAAAQALLRQLEGAAPPSAR